MTRDIPSPVGLKMPLGWRDSARWRELSSPHEDLLQYVAGTGLTHVEFSCGGCRDEEERRSIRTEAQACADHGLAAYLHPYMEDPEDACSYGTDERAEEAMNRVVDAAAEVASLCGSSCVVVFHPGSADIPRDVTERPAHRRRMVDRAADYLRALEKRAAEEEDVTPVVEHQVPPGDDEALMRVGDTYEELLGVVRGTDLGLCWDTGHYLRAMADRGQSDAPPEEMFRRTAYVHLHDVVEGADHRPVTSDTRRPASFVKGLWHMGYDGPVTLEYHEEPMLRSGGLEEVIGTSLDVLAEWARR